MAMGLFTEREFVVRQRGAFEVNPPQVRCATCVPRGARESPGSCGAGGLPAQPTMKRTWRPRMADPGRRRGVRELPGLASERSQG